MPVALSDATYVAGCADTAIRAEAMAADGLLALAPDARKMNVHYTQVRTKNPKDVQPHQLTQAQFWEHLCACARIAYPRASSETGSILEFGLIAKERHKDAPREEDRSEHNHGATHASEPYRWKKIREISAERFNIQLNAVAHETYTSMFCYLRCPTAKKPIQELDWNPFFSPAHPQGDKLKKLLEQGHRYKQVRQAQLTLQPSPSPSPSSATVRSQFGVVYNWVTTHNLRKRKGAKQLEADAVSELQAGRPQLLEFCKKHKTCLEDQLDYIWQMATAKEDVKRLDKSLLDLLLEATIPDLPTSRLKEQCSNEEGGCAKIYAGILDYHQLNALQFCHELYETLKFGRRKGNAFMVVGGRDAGKTTLTQPAEHIYKTMKCPQSDSFCPLESIRGHDVLLWQDFRFNPGHPKKDEVGLRLDIGTWNRLLEGLPTPIGVPKSDGSRSDFLYEENAPLIATGPFQPVGYKDGVANEKETEQITCRIKFWHLRRPAPDAGLNRTLKPCPVCWSRWILQCAAAWQLKHGAKPDAFLEKVAANGNVFDPAAMQSSGPACSKGYAAKPSSSAGSSGSTGGQADQFARLQALVEWRKSGLLTDAEFARFKKECY